VNTCVTCLWKLRNLFTILVTTSQMASARGAHSATDGYSRFSDGIDNIGSSYQSNSISKLNKYLLVISITLIFLVLPYAVGQLTVIFDICNPLPAIRFIVF
jgi:hypothetical protein